MNKYKILNVIGDGTYGTVYKGINIETNEYVAIKQLKDKNNILVILMKLEFVVFHYQL